MTFRIWYPQLDIYDTIRRMCVLLAKWQGNELSEERLYILDFYFANPPMLHQTHMPQEIRDKFSKLDIEKPSNAFLSYPSPPILFQKMEEVQKYALWTLIGKNIISEDTKHGNLVLSENAEKSVVEKMLFLQTDIEKNISEFLAFEFGKISIGNISDFRNRTGLRRIS